MPNFFGNPSHHAYLDLFTWRMTPITENVAGEAINHTDWGIKNYVEGAAYLGILPMALALIAFAHWIAGAPPSHPKSASAKSSPRSSSAQKQKAAPTA